jgi:hypothetical protein
MFVPSLLMYLVFMGICWGMALTNPTLKDLFNQPGQVLPTLLMMPTIGWGSSLFFHFMGILGEFGVFDTSIRSRILIREIGEKVLEQGTLAYRSPVQSEKAKRTLDDAEPIENKRPVVRLSDDGELVPLEPEWAAHKESLNGKGSAS